MSKVFIVVGFLLIFFSGLAFADVNESLKPLGSSSATSKCVLDKDALEAMTCLKTELKKPLNKKIKAIKRHFSDEVLVKDEGNATGSTLKKTHSQQYN